jgi:hypothetical protein
MLRSPAVQAVNDGWEIINNSSGRPDIPLYHFRTLSSTWLI